MVWLAGVELAHFRSIQSSSYRIKHSIIPTIFNYRNEIFYWYNSGEFELLLQFFISKFIFMDKIFNGSFNH